MGSLANVDQFIASALAGWQRDFDLRPRIHRLRGDVDVNPADNTGDSMVLNLPTDWPFLLCAIGWGSNRDYDGQLLALQLRTENATFITDPVRLMGLSGIHGEAGPCPWGPSVIVAKDRLTAVLTRLTAPDPTDTYPLPTAHSIVDILLIGYDLIKKPKREE